MSIELVMPSSHLILCRPLLLLPPTPPSIRVFSNESTLRIRWPKYWSFSFNEIIYIKFTHIKCTIQWVLVYLQNCATFTNLVAQLVKNPPAMQETWVQSLGWEDSPEEVKGYPLQYSGLENSMDCIVHGVTKNWT